MSLISEFVLDRISEDETEARKHTSLPTSRDINDEWAFRAATRTLAESGVKRRLVRWAELAGNLFVLSQLASIYDGHADWREDWRP